MVLEIVYFLINLSIASVLHQNKINEKETIINRLTVLPDFDRFAHGYSACTSFLKLPMFGLASYSFEHFVIKEPAVCYQHTGIQNCRIPLVCFRLNTVLSKGLETRFADCIGFLCSSSTIYAFTGTYRALVLTCRKGHLEDTTNQQWYVQEYPVNYNLIISHCLPLLNQMTCDFCRTITTRMLSMKRLDPFDRAP